MQECKEQFSFPWFIYENFPFKGYVDIDEYREELNRLIKFIESFNIQKNTYLHFIIGAAMEEDNKHPKYYNQYKQLCPEFLINSITNDNDNFNSQIIIVSPNSSFTEKYYEEPLFLSKTNNIFSWEKISTKSYKSKKYNLSVDIFCTLLPHDELARNQRIMKRLKEHKIYYEYPYVQKGEQTQNDVVFVKSFYKILTNFFDEINNKNGVVTCFSYAVFNDNTNLKNINNYSMFSEIKELFKDFPSNNRLLCEWVFKIDNYTVIPYNIKEKFIINYNFANFEDDNIKNIFVDFNNEDKLEIYYC